MTSLIMPVRDSRTWAERALASVARHTSGAFELLVVDNASGPETAGYLRTTGTRLVRNEENRGCAGAWNQGIRLARGEHVCLLNSDVEVPSGWLHRLAAFHGRHGFAWVSPAIREGALDYDLEALNRRVRARVGDRHFADEYRGMVLFSRRDVYERLGPFDEGYVCGKYEDEDMFWRLRLAGLRAAVTPSVVVHHHGSRTVREERLRTPGFEARNKAYFERKWWALRLARRGHRLRLGVRHLLARARHGLTY